MNDEHTSAGGTLSSSRLAQFEDEVAKLKVTGGGANPERLGSRWWLVLLKPCENALSRTNRSRLNQEEKCSPQKKASRRGCGR